MSIPEKVTAKKKEIVAKLELLQQGLLDSERTAKLRKSLKFDNDGNLQLFERGKFITIIGEITGGEVLVGDKFVIDSDALQDLINPPEINWQKASRTLLIQNTERLTTNPMTHCEGIVHETEQVYIPLGLVERKKQSRRENDVSPEQGSSLYEETEITRKFEHKEFISRVLVDGDSPKSKGRRISIIGEPGAGKTTSLQQVSTWVASNVGDAVVIWVPLADLQGRSLEEYLFEHWLQSVTRISGYAEVSKLIKNEFISLFQQDNIWLMLDGVDEISGLFRNPLNELDSQLTGTLLSQAKVLLTCRLNLWDGNRHSLDNFDIYRTLEFSYPLQVEGFIQNWFALRATATLARRLCAALGEPKAKRIQDLVKNPLRLALLCFSWSLREGTLPETQAQLYAQYVESIYDWKREQFPISNSQQRLLDSALSILSCKAIDRAEGYQNSRFRLREELVEEYLNKPLPGSDGTIFDLALKIGWINQVGIDANDPSQKIYAFYHTTFEEYFAALSIEKGNFFFFSHSRWNPNSKRNSYRLLESHWKQVFILWCGRANISSAEKDNLIRDLIYFKDGCRGFYSDKAFFVACEGINEFDSTHAKKIVQRLMRWRESSLIDYFLLGEEKAHARAEDSKEAIKQTRTRHNNSIFAIQHLTKIVQGERIIWERRSPSALLEAVDPGNELAVQTLSELINSELCKELDDRRYAIENLGELAAPNIEVIRVLCEALAEKRLGAAAAKSLEQIVENRESKIELETIIFEVSKSLKSLKDLKFATAPSDISGFFESLRSSPRGVIDLLEKIGVGSQTAHRALVELLNYKIESTNNLYDYPSIRKIVKSIEKISVNADSNPVVGQALTILDTQNVEVNKDIPFPKLPVKQNCRGEDREINSVNVARSFVKDRAVSLFEFDNSCKLVGKEMLSIIKSTSEQLVRKEAVQILSGIVEWHTPSIHELMEVLETSNDEEIFLLTAERLYEICEDRESLIKSLSRVAAKDPAQSCTLLAIDFLGKMEAETHPIVKLLTSLIENSKDEFILIHAANSLVEICGRNELALKKLKFLSKVAVDRHARIAASRIAGKFDSETELAIENLVQIMEECDTTTEEDELICNHAYHALSDIGTNSVTATTELCRLLNKGMGRLHHIVAACLCKICDHSNNEEIKAQLLKAIENSRDRHSIVAFTISFKLIEENNEKLIHELSRILGESPRDVFLSGSKNHGCLALALEENLTEDANAINLTIRELRRFRRQSEACKLLMRCSEATSYEDFLRAFRQGRWIQIVHVFHYKTWLVTFYRMREWCIALSS